MTMKNSTELAEIGSALTSLQEAAARASNDDEARQITSDIAELTRRVRIIKNIGIPGDPVTQALQLDQSFVSRPPLDYLGQRVASAVRDMERGKSRMMAVSMPPRTGKTTMLSIYSPLWILRRHPEWKIVTASHDGNLSSGWARQLRRIIEKNPSLGIALANDGGAGGQWETREGGGLFSTSTKGSLTGRGARVLIIDDPVKDFVESHSLAIRQNLWDWWLSVALTRLEPPYLVLVVMTRWHEDDMIGRLFSPDYEGDSRQWERISLPAIADTSDDVLDRAQGEPLLSPIVDESPDEALHRWEDVRRAVGTYTFSAMYQQRPAPARGAIFDSSWWRYWTSDESKVTDDGRVVYLDPSSLVAGRWLDSWDLSFKASSPSVGGWVVGQRWVRGGANRYLVSQQRGRWTFTQTIAAMERWMVTDDPSISLCGNLVHERLIEDRANGSAIIDVLKDRISGIKPINPTTGKEARARAVTPEIESGNVFIPHPSDPGNEWVNDFLSEMRNFPYDPYDDQVDTLTQALAALRSTQAGRASVPGRLNKTKGWQVSRDVARAAMSDNARRRL